MEDLMRTRLRYEVWVNSTGRAEDWRRLPGCVFVSESEFNIASKQNATAHAEALALAFQKVCVEEYDDGRDVFLQTIREYPIK
jgi:hypothetical protein